MLARISKWMIVTAGLAMVVVLHSCATDDDIEEQEQERILVLRMDQDVVVPTSKIRIELGGTDRVQADAAEVSIAGEIGERAVAETFELTTVRDGEVGNLYLVLDAQALLWPRLEPGADARFRGSLEVQMRDALGIPTRGVIEDVSWHFLRELSPVIHFESPSQLFSNTAIDVEGEGVLRPEEGETVAVADTGRFYADRGHEIDLTGEVFPVEWKGDRQRGDLRMDPAVLGVHPGELEATLRFENRFDDGTTLASPVDPVEVAAEFPTAFIANVSPRKASRGQTVELDGRGFVPRDNEAGYGMLLQFEGTLTPADPALEPRTFAGESAQTRVPYQVVDDEQLLQDIWYDVIERRLEGLGAMPGTFDGSITPVLYDQYGEVEGIAWQGEFEVLPTRQMVYLKYLPAFSVALDRYGLVNVEREIRSRILDVVNRDYEGINLEFVEEPPEDFAKFATVELGGPDPTGGYAFGFDNTYNEQAKDTGNLHIDDYLGGINPETGEEFNNPYGGVFVESFARFSPTLYPEMGHASENFDAVFGPFMPELGGERIRATEWPDGDRTEAIAEVIRVFANVIGNTVSHELGHALGLAHFEGDWDSPGHIYHNTGGSGGIMDPGAERSFEQRAELDGEEASGFNARNRAYLESILPVDG